MAVIRPMFCQLVGSSVAGKAMPWRVPAAFESYSLWLLLTVPVPRSDRNEMFATAKYIRSDVRCVQRGSHFDCLRYLTLHYGKLSTYRYEPNVASNF